MKAWELLSDKSKWTTDRYARTAEGLGTAANAEDATCWCAVGAVHKCYQGSEGRHKKLALLQDWVTAKTGNHRYPIVAWNDASTYEDVVAALKELDI